MIEGTIYELTCTTTGDNYIGSTTKTLRERFCRHKINSRDASRDINNKLYKLMREHGVESFSIKPLFV